MLSIYESVSLLDAEIEKVRGIVRVLVIKKKSALIREEQT